MNPCIGCPLIKLGCHEKTLSGKSFADEHCDLWYDWLLELFRPDKFIEPVKPVAYEQKHTARRTSL